MNIKKINNVQPSFKAYIESPEGQKKKTIVNVNSIEVIEKCNSLNDQAEWLYCRTNIYTKGGRKIEMHATISDVMTAVKKALNSKADEVIKISEENVKSILKKGK